MAFDRTGFIKAAREQNYDDASINAYLKQKGQKPVSKLENVVNSPWIPRAGGIAGGVVGAIGGPLVSTAGAGLGAGVATGMQQSAKRLMGIPNGTPQDQSKEFFGNTGSAVATAGTINTLIPLLKTIIDPLGQIKNLAGKFRSSSIGNQGVDTSNFETAAQQAMKNNPDYQMAVSPAQQQGNEALGRFNTVLNPAAGTTQNPTSFQGGTPTEGSGVMSTINRLLRGPGGNLVPQQTSSATLNSPAPGEITGPIVNPQIGGGDTAQIAKPEITGINDIYKALNSFERVNKPFVKNTDNLSTTITQGNNFADRAIREYLSSQIPQAAQTANRVYQAASNVEASKTLSNIRKYGTYFALYKLLGPQIQKLFAGDK